MLQQFLITAELPTVAAGKHNMDSLCKPHKIIVVCFFFVAVSINPPHITFSEKVRKQEITQNVHSLVHPTMQVTKSIMCKNNCSELNNEIH